MERISIYLDAGNFYHLFLKKLNLKELDFDFDAFANFLAKSGQIIQGGKRFYIGTVREKQDGHENTVAMSNQNKLFTSLKNKGGWLIGTSKLRTRLEKITIDDRVKNYKTFLKNGLKEVEYLRSREKGIDVKLAVNLIVGAMDNQYDTAIIVSSDSDLVPAIDAVRRRFKKKVEYVGFSIPKSTSWEATVPTKTMIFNTDVQRVFIEEDLKPFIKKASV